jgi:hypothetical protein
MRMQTTARDADGSLTIMLSLDFEHLGVHPTLIDKLPVDLISANRHSADDPYING